MKKISIGSRAGAIDAVIVTGGLVTVRITWERMTRAPRAEAARLRTIFERRRTG